MRITVGTASLPATGQAGTVLQIKARTTVVLRVKAPSGHRTSQVMIVVTPLAGSGPVYAGRVISSGAVVQSIAAVPSSLTWVPIPVVHSSLSAIVP